MRNAATWLIALVVSSSSIAASLPNEKESLAVEIARMMNNLHWRKMIEISLERGDTQALAKRAPAITQEQIECINREYTADAMMALIGTSYERVYSSSHVVSEINQFVESAGGQKIFSAVAEKSKIAGPRQAAEKLRYDQILTPQEKKQFELFSASDSGREYIEARRKLPSIQRELLMQFARSVQVKCGVG